MVTGDEPQHGVAGRSDQERSGGVHGPEPAAGFAEVMVPWPPLWPEHPGLSVPGPQNSWGSEEASAKLFGVGVFEDGACEEVELEPAAQGVGPADHRGPDPVAGGVVEREPAEPCCFESFDVLFDVGVFALAPVDLQRAVAREVADDDGVAPAVGVEHSLLGAGV